MAIIQCSKNNYYTHIIRQCWVELELCLPYIDYISLVKRPFFVTYTFRQTEIPASLDSSGQTHLLSKCCAHKKKIFSQKRNMLNCWSVEDRSSCCEVVSVSYDRLVVQESYMVTGLGGSEEILK